MATSTSQSTQSDNTPTGSGVLTLNPKDISAPVPVYSQVTVVPLSPTSKLVTVAGQTGVTVDKTIPPTFPEQVDLCLSKVSSCLSAAGAKVSDIIRLVYYVVEKEHDPQTTPRVLVERLEPWLNGHAPASCYLVVAGLVHPDYLVEFEASAVVNTPVT